MFRRKKVEAKPELTEYEKYQQIQSCKTAHRAREMKIDRINTVIIHIKSTFRFKIGEGPIRMSNSRYEMYFFVDGKFTIKYESPYYDTYRHRAEEFELTEEGMFNMNQEYLNLLEKMFVDNKVVHDKNGSIGYQWRVRSRT